MHVAYNNPLSVKRGSMPCTGKASQEFSCEQGVQWQSANADTIAALVDLSASEVRELLGEERGCTMAELGQEVAAVLSCCEAILLPGVLARLANLSQCMQQLTWLQ